VETGSIRGVIRTTGVVAPAPDADLVVVAPEPSRIAAIPKAEGDRVRRGDLLVQFEIPATAADVANKNAEVTRARARLANAKAAQARAHDLFDRGVAARKDVEDADRDLADEEAALVQANAALSAAQVIATRSSVRATFDGIVAKRAHNPGDFVEAAASDPVLRVIDPRRLEVSALVPVGEIPRLTIGAAARLVSTTTEEEPVRLKVISRPAVVDTGTATVPVRLAFAEPPRQAVGMAVQVDIDGELHKEVLLIPTRAIVREADETAVFVVADGKAHRREVHLGLTDAEHTEVKSGLKAGEMVIVDGQAGLPDGAAVSVGDKGEKSDKTEKSEKDEKSEKGEKK
jgi:RND family efflux transporter MFP subunit